MRMTRENKTYAEVGEEVLDVYLLPHHVDLDYHRISWRG